VGYVPWFLVEIGNCIHDLEAEVDLHFTEAFDKGWIKKIDKIDKSNLKDIMKVAGYTAAGGGGTEFRRVYKDLIELNPRYDLIILFTDCYTDPPRERLHAPSGRTVVLNVGNPKTSWKYCEIYNVEVPSSENINPYG
jgi:predicted metal-dependent peptidase